MEFNDSTLIILGMLGAGGLAGLAYYLSGRVGTKSNILEAVKNIKENMIQNNIDTINQEQVVVRDRIIKSENLSVEKKEAIKDIQKKAAIEIESILHEESVQKVQEEIDKQWGDI